MKAHRRQKTPHRQKKARHQRVLPIFAPIFEMSAFAVETAAGSL